MIGEKDDGKTIVLKLGKSLVVTLEGNNTTGYTWEVLPQDPPLLQQVGSPKVTPHSSRIGAGGKIAFTFQAVQAGQAALRLVYHRTWDTGAPPARTFEVKIKVK